MRDIEHANMLIELAAEELQALTAMKDPAVFSSRLFGFHAQQVVEKTLKAWLSLLGVNYPLTHNLGVLLDLVEDDAGPDAQQFRDLDSLTPFAVQFRYGPYEGPSDEIDRPQTASRLSELLEFVNALISQM